MSIQESKSLAKRLMEEIQSEVLTDEAISNLRTPSPKKHLDRISGALETVFTFNTINDDQQLIDALINEDGYEAEVFAKCAGFSELQLAVNKYRNSL